MSAPGQGASGLAFPAALGLLVAITGCASIVSGTTQTVAVTTVCEGVIVPQASCTLANDKGKWEATTPQPVVIQKSYGDLSVVCTKAGSTGSASFVSKPNGGAWGNILAGGVIGYAVDSGNGAGFNYPAEVAVVLAAPCPTAN